MSIVAEAWTETQTETQYNSSLSDPLGSEAIAKLMEGTMRPPAFRAQATSVSGNIANPEEVRYAGAQSGVGFFFVDLLEGGTAFDLSYEIPVKTRTSTTSSEASVSRRPERTELGRVISLEEAWEHAGQVFREAEARRKHAREIEARTFLNDFVNE
jgi:hypothetical protein